MERSRDNAGGGERGEKAGIIHARATSAARNAGTIGRGAAQALIRVYQLSFSALAGRQCRHWPTCSDYAREAIGRHGVWPGSWIGFSRICRCGPFGTHGIDLVPDALPVSSAWYKPWSFGRWRGVNAPAMACQAIEPQRGHDPA